MAEQIQIIDERVTCTSCDRWEWQSSGKLIRHNPNRCDDPTAQLGAAQPKPDSQVERYAGKFSKQSPGSGLTSDELASDVKRGYLSQSDAMNTDF